MSRLLKTDRRAPGLTQWAEGLADKTKDYVMTEKQLVVPTAIVLFLMVFWLIGTDRAVTSPIAGSNPQTRQIKARQALPDNPNRRGIVPVGFRIT